MSSLACSQNCPEEPSGVAYETLLLDSTRGVATLLTRRDEVEAEWRIITPIEEAWAHLPPPDFPNYAAGSEGPSSWNELLEIRGNIAEAAIGNGKSCPGLPPGTPCSVAAPVDCMSMRPLRLVSFQEVIESLQEEKTLMKTPIDEKRFGPWALVTGASSGIGKEFVRQLAAAGLNVALVARRETLLYAVGQGIAKDFNVQYRTVVADLSQGGFLDKLAKATNDLDIGLVVSNAGTGNPGEFLKIDRVELENLLRLNTLAHLDIAHQFGQRLVGRGQGGLLLVGAMGADKGVPYMANDGGAKAYVQSFSEGLHVELKPLGVHVTVLLPGPTDTAVIAKFGFAPDSMPMRPMTVEQCVSEGLKALQNNRSMIIPGRLNRIMNAVVPASVVRGMVAKMFKKMLANRLVKREMGARG